MSYTRIWNAPTVEREAAKHILARLIAGPAARSSLNGYCLRVEVGPGENRAKIVDRALRKLRAHDVIHWHYNMWYLGASR